MEKKDIMRWFMKFTGRALPFFIILILFSCAKKSGSGVIEIKPSEIRLGRVSAGKTVDSYTVVKNLGKDELIIKKVRSDCECIFVEHVPHYVPPQKEDTLKFKFIAPIQKGETKKTLFIESNDKVKPIVTLNVYAYIEPSYMDSTLAVLMFQAEDQKFGYELAVAVAEKARELKRFKVVKSDELVEKILSDPNYKKVETDKLIRKWGDSLGIRYVVTGQLRNEKSEKINVILIFIDAFFEYPIVRRVEGKKEELHNAVTREFKETMENIEKVEHEAWLQVIQAKWTQKRNELVGKSAPNFSLTSLDGRKISLSDYRGKTLLIHFFSLTCEACIEELEWIKSVSEKPKCAVIGVSIDTGKEEELKKLIKQRSLKYPVIVVSQNDSTFLNSFYVNVTPQTIVIDKNGIIRESMVGFSEGLKSSFEHLVDEISK
ncbi:MAG: redoxin domain-containing protein [bacterium]